MITSQSVHLFSGLFAFFSVLTKLQHLSTRMRCRYWIVCEELWYVPRWCKYASGSALHPWKWPGSPWFQVHMDYAGPIQGKWILAIVNAHSKYIDAHIVSSPSSSVTERMLRRTFATHGSPHVIVSDNASSFTSKEFSRFCALNDIKHVRCAPYHPS